MPKKQKPRYMQQHGAVNTEEVYSQLTPDARGLVDDAAARIMTHCTTQDAAVMEPSKVGLRNFGEKSAQELVMRLAFFLDAHGERDVLDRVLGIEE